MRKKVLRKLLVLWPLLALLVALPVYAAVTYTAALTVTETGGTDYTQLAIRHDLDVATLQSEGYITATGLDTRVMSGATALPHMLSVDKLLLADALGANSSQSYEFTTNNTALASFDVVLGRGGSIAVNDHATLELEDSFEVEIRGWVDTAGGANKNLLFKDAAFKLYINGDGQIDADINNGVKVASATGIASGLHTIEVIADGVDMKIYVDTVEEGTVALGATSVTDNGNNWAVAQNNVLPYMEYIMIYTAN